jgi:D-alanine-D-alanine ligase
MDKCTTHILADRQMIRQAMWEAVSFRAFDRDPDRYISCIEKKFSYPFFVKPSGTGSSVGVTKVFDRASLPGAIRLAGKYDDKVL